MCLGLWSLVKHIHVYTYIHTYMHSSICKHVNTSGLKISWILACGLKNEKRTKIRKLKIILKMCSRVQLKKVWVHGFPLAGHTFNTKLFGTRCRFMSSTVAAFNTSFPPNTILWAVVGTPSIFSNCCLMDKIVSFN